MHKKPVVEEFKCGIEAFVFAGELSHAGKRCKLFKQSWHWYVVY